MSIPRPSSRAGRPPSMPVPTPAVTALRDPTAGERAQNETGVDRFRHLATRGSFKCWDWRILPGATDKSFNCFAWSLGFTDRWVEGGSRAQMNRLYHHYMFVDCSTTPNEAEVELYDIPTAPAQLSRTIPASARNPQPRTISWANPRAVVLHAHRRDNPALDAPPGWGCSSKLAKEALIIHNRHALEDDIAWPGGNPAIRYGIIYQQWKRDPTRHPSFPGNEANDYPEAGHYPDDPVFEGGPGEFPAGHPGDTNGLNLSSGSGSNGASGSGTITGNQAGKTTTLASRTVTSSTRSSNGSSNSSSGSSTHSRSSSQTSVTSTASSKDKGKGKAATPSPFRAYSGKSYALANMPSYGKIPAPTTAAVKLAKAGYDATIKSQPTFEAAWAAWIKNWNATKSSNAAAATSIEGFEALRALGPKIVPLVVYKLASDPTAFVGTFLYNALETNKDYMVHPKDLLNYCVLQRQANLIVEMNGLRPAPKK
ncbi:hypothetical protein B0H63DRAFT_252940 [Podospora didyma]|uniref:DUF7689 domain-containing protein n=1 Tax=Podospora didyma TaxID=330526 RepID=A0AAE0KEJ4_9PEZI|nr:hypothetical protein B0H63DRAFT_252940 [Podospora didyma]